MEMNSEIPSKARDSRTMVSTKGSQLEDFMSHCGEKLPKLMGYLCILGTPVTKEYISQVKVLVAQNLVQPYPREKFASKLKLRFEVGLQSYPQDCPLAVGKVQLPQLAWLLRPHSPIPKVFPLGPWLQST